jgi:hypothetical protein
VTASRLLTLIAFASLLTPCAALAQQNVPPAAQNAQNTAAETARKFGAGVQGGIGLDPEIIDFGAHATFGPIFTPSLQFRPGIEFGIGEVTTLFGINLDLLYTMPGFDRDTTWRPYVGAGPNFTLSHRGFETDETDKVDTPGTTTTTTTTATTTDQPGRFDFSDTDFSGGMNFIVGMRKRSGAFFEMKATAWGVANVRLLAGFNF